MEYRGLGSPASRVDYSVSVIRWLFEPWREELNTVFYPPATIPLFHENITRRLYISSVYYIPPLYTFRPRYVVHQTVRTPDDLLTRQFASGSD